MEIGVLGGGSWGTALAVAFAANGNQVSLWFRSSEIYKNFALKRCNESYLPGVRIPQAVKPTMELEEAVRGKKIILLAIPAAELRWFLQELRPLLNVPGVSFNGRDSEGVNFNYLINAGGGLEAESHMRPSQILFQELPPKLHPRVAFMAGPAYAEELVSSVNSILIISSFGGAAARELLPLLQTPHLQVHYHHDYAGLELAAAFSGIMAVGTGINIGMKQGEAAVGGLFAKLYSEVIILGTSLGGEENTFRDPIGLGTFYSACTSQYSRNHLAGIKLGEGRRLSDIINDKLISGEGIAVTSSAYSLAHLHQLNTPALNLLYGVLFAGKDPSGFKGLWN